MLIFSINLCFIYLLLHLINLQINKYFSLIVFSTFLDFICFDVLNVPEKKNKNIKILNKIVIFWSFLKILKIELIIDVQIKVFHYIYNVFYMCPGPF